MSHLANALAQLRGERTQAQQQVEKLDVAIHAIEGLVGRNGSGASRNGARPGRTVSAAGRARIAAAQRARWARVRKESQSAGGKTTTPPAKRTMSASARRKIAAAQRARWAKVRATKAA